MPVRSKFENPTRRNRAFDQMPPMPDSKNGCPIAPVMMPASPYLLLTPGPLTTTPTVKATMLRDWCTWDRDYNDLVQDIRARLVALATRRAQDYTAVLMQGSGTFAVEAAIGSLVPAEGRLLVLTNGAYGDRIAQIARVLRIDVVVLDSGEVAAPDLDALDRTLAADSAITHVAAVHCETTTGMLNPVDTIGAIVARHGRTFLVDAMSSFGGIAFDIADWKIDIVVSSANKCIQGVPGFGFAIVRRSLIEASAGRARSLALDLHDQWKTMESGAGKWRYTSPTHVVRAFRQALDELDAEGGVPARQARYTANQRLLAQGMASLGFELLLDPALQSPIITSFLYPSSPAFDFGRFYEAVKGDGYVLYPGKIGRAPTFRIGNIGDVHLGDIERLLGVVARHRFWLEPTP